MRLAFPKTQSHPVKIRDLPQTHEEAHIFWAKRLDSICTHCTNENCSGFSSQCTYVECKSSRGLEARCPECNGRVPDNPPSLQGLKGTLPELTCAAAMVVHQLKHEFILQQCDITPRTLNSLSRRIGSLYCLACDEVIILIKNQTYFLTWISLGSCGGKFEGNLSLQNIHFRTWISLGSSRRKI